MNTETLPQIEKSERRREIPPPPDDALLAFQFLQAGYSSLTIAAGADKFFDSMTRWEGFLSPAVSSWSGARDALVMKAVGALEIALGLLVALRPRMGAAAVAAWLGAIIFNLLLIPGRYDVALRDSGLMIGAVALWRLSVRYGR